MKSLRQTLETTFSAAAFAESGLHKDALTEMGVTRTQDKRADNQPGKRAGKHGDRPRPTLKA